MTKWLPLVLMLVASTTVGADIEAGKAKAQAVCSACHNDDGNSSQAIYPKLGGQHAAYLLKQLQNYKDPDSGRSNAIMAGMVAGLTEQDMINLAEYFASQATSSGATEKQFYELGRQIYLGGNLDSGVPACSGCHGPAGKGNAPAGFPKLAGQHPEYTISQLKAFHSKERQNDFSAMMRMVAVKMTETEMEAVAHFIAGMQ